MFDDQNENTLEFVSVKGSYMTHKQIEYRQGLIFMRMKKRAIRSGV